MKKYGICLLLFVIISLACFSVGYLVTKPRPVKESAVPGSTYETETVTEEPHLVINQQVVEPVSADRHEQFYLVSETGYLLVFSEDQSTICLYTHIPITEFPEREQEKLRQGIWFPTMMEVFQYLESYTS